MEINFVFMLSRTVAEFNTGRFLGLTLIKDISYDVPYEVGTDGNPRTGWNGGDSSPSCSFSI